MPSYRLSTPVLRLPHSRPEVRLRPKSVPCQLVNAAQERSRLPGRPPVRIALSGLACSTASFPIFHARFLERNRVLPITSSSIHVCPFRPVYSNHWSTSRYERLVRTIGPETTAQLDRRQQPVHKHVAGGRIQTSSRGRLAAGSERIRHENFATQLGG